VTGVEPHPPLVRRATKLMAGLPNVRVVTGGAQRLPLPAASVDLCTRGPRTSSAEAANPVCLRQTECCGPAVGWPSSTST